MKDDFDQVVISVFVGVFISIASCSSLLTDYDDKVFHDDYCANVEMWELDTDAGIDPGSRAGHPNYKGVECDQEKD